MDELGLFPLPIVLLPTERLPLHIFEPRYRELIGECIEEAREFGLVLVDDDGLRSVGTSAGVAEVLERLDDGRLNVLVEGRRRFRVRELTSGRSFHTALVEHLDDEETEPDAGALERVVERLQRLADLSGAEVESLEPVSPTPSYELASRIHLEPELKQRLLELRSESERLRELAGVLDAAAQALERRQAVSRLAQGNGTLAPRPPREQ